MAVPLKSIALLVSVPFTSGSSLQLTRRLCKVLQIVFQFPLHRDPRCNRYYFELLLSSAMFQFPLHRDPRCNASTPWRIRQRRSVSVPFTSGSSLQLKSIERSNVIYMFQFPLHRDPRCNSVNLLRSAAISAFQFPLHRDPRCNTLREYLAEKQE